MAAIGRLQLSCGRYRYCPMPWNLHRRCDSLLWKTSFSTKTRKLWPIMVDSEPNNKKGRSFTYEGEPVLSEFVFWLIVVNRLHLSSEAFYVRGLSWMKRPPTLSEHHSGRAFTKCTMTLASRWNIHLWQISRKPLLFLCLPKASPHHHRLWHWGSTMWKTNAFGIGEEVCIKCWILMTC